MINFIEYLFSLGLDHIMLQEPAPKYRTEVLKDASGKILEVGFGTGINIDYYPENIKEITTIEPNKSSNKIADKRIKKSNIKVNQVILGGENLPFKDSEFDTVVSTWTLCSIPKVSKALKEIYRVLKPGGKFIFIEHGLSPEKEVERLQHLATPFTKCLLCGCHMNRNIKRLITDSGFNFKKLNEFYMEETPKVDGYTYQGMATK